MYGRKIVTDRGGRFWSEELYKEKVIFKEGNNGEEGK